MKKILLSIFLLTVLGLTSCNSASTENRLLSHIETLDNGLGVFIAEELIVKLQSSSKINKKDKIFFDQYLSNIAQRRLRAREEIIEVESKIVVGHYPKANFKFFFQLAYLYDVIQKHDLALRYYNESIQLKDKNSLAYIKRGQLYRQMRQKEKYRQDILTAQSLAPDDPLTIMAQCLLFIDEKKFDEAGRLIKKLSTKHRNMSLALQYLIDQKNSKGSS